MTLCDFSNSGAENEKNEGFSLALPEYSEYDIEQYSEHHAYDKHGNYRCKKGKAILTDYYISRQAA